MALQDRLARWRLRLAEFDFGIKYRPGIKNSVADGCSRVPTTGGDMADLDNYIPCFMVYHPSPSLSSTLPLPIAIEEIQRAQHETRIDNNSLRIAPRPLPTSQ
jgi:hypothetical protein